MSRIQMGVCRVTGGDAGGKSCPPIGGPPASDEICTVVVGPGGATALLQKSASKPFPGLDGYV
jgi:hypothetical protein